MIEGTHDVEIGPKIGVKTDLRTLVAIILAAAGGMGAWVHLEMKVGEHERSIDTLLSVQAIDHDLLQKLDNRTEWLARAKPTTAAILSSPAKGS